MIVFELVGLACADGSCRPEEREIVDTVARKFGLDDGFVAGCEELAARYGMLRKEIEGLLF